MLQYRIHDTQPQAYIPVKTLHYIRGLQPFEFEGHFYNFHIILRAAVIADYKIIMYILNIIIGAWAARQVT